MEQLLLLLPQREPEPSMTPDRAATIKKLIADLLLTIVRHDAKRETTDDNHD